MLVSPTAYLTEVLGVVLRGHKHHRLVLGPHHGAQQVEQHSSLGVLAHKEEGGLRGEGPRWAHRVSAAGARRGPGGASP